MVEICKPGPTSDKKILMNDNQHLTPSKSFKGKMDNNTTEKAQA
jgi:hypothetical protein